MRDFRIDLREGETVNLSELCDRMTYLEVQVRFLNHIVKRDIPALAKRLNELEAWRNA